VQERQHARKIEYVKDTGSVVTDTQILTLAIAMVVPLALLLLSNSRLTDLRTSLHGEIEITRTSLQTSIAEAKETLRAEMLARHNEQMTLLNAIMGKLDGLDTRLTALEGRK